MYCNITHVYSKVFRGNKPGELHPSRRLFEVVHLDQIGPLIRSIE